MHNLFEKLDNNTVLVTHLPRQAQQFHLAFAKWKRQQNIQAWPSPKIFSWTEWLKSLGETLLWSGYSSSEGVRSLLTPLQEQLVWEQVIRSQTDQPLMHVPSTASMARQAWNLMQVWRLPDPRAAKFPTEDVSAFSNWAAKYFKRCKSAAWVDQARLADTIKAALKQDALPLPEDIVFAGFCEFTPQQLEFINCLESQNSKVSIYKSKEFTQEPVGYSFESLQDESSAIAKWVREVLEKEPQASIGIVAVNLSQTHPELEYALRKHLYPESFLSKEDFTNTAYQFSSAKSLSQSELAQMAMNLLELIHGKFSLEQIGQILRNPYCYGGKEEFAERLQLYAWLQQQGVQEFDLKGLLDTLKRYQDLHSETAKATFFEVSMMTLRTSNGLIKNNYTPSVWAKHFLSYLEKFGWPAKELTHSEQREAQAMRSCLTEFATLDFVQSEINFSLAISSIRRIFLKKSINHAQVYAPIQVMDIKECYGLNFDYLWVCGLTQTSLPVSPHINPMLPFAWQKKRLLSLSTPELCLQEAQQRLTHLTHAASRTVFSYVATGNINSEQTSNLLANINFSHVATKKKILVDNQSEWITENYASELKNSKQVGTSVFKFQAECPFKAYAKTRLLPRTVEHSLYGLSALERGNLLHRALEKIWLSLGDSDTLKIALDNEHLEIQIWEIVDNVVFAYEKKQGQKISQRLKAIEKTRLVRLVLAWLKLESERTPFSMQQVEESVELEINGLKVKGYIDRIDKIHKVGFAIIDYKSGAKTASAWFGERPDEPQMPIYALAMQNKITAIVYANLKANDMGFKGISHEQNAFPGIKAYDKAEARRRGYSWAELMPHWRETLNNLAEDYKKGLAVPDPKRNLQTCEYCKLETLCRVNANQDAGLFLENNDHD